MARYEILKQIREYQEVTLTTDTIDRVSYSKILPSGDLWEEHYDYGIGFYDVSMYYMRQVRDSEDIHVMRVWFGTIDDGSFGVWKELDSREECIQLLDKVVDRFKSIKRCPSSKRLNEIFRDLGIYFCIE